MRATIWGGGRRRDDRRPSAKTEAGLSRHWRKKRRCRDERPADSHAESAAMQA